MKRAVVVLLLCVQYALSVDYQVTPSTSGWITTLINLKAGDTMTFAAGTYNYQQRLGPTWAGTAAKPILIQAAAGATVTLVQNDGNNNVIDLSGSYFTIKNIGWKGTAADGVRAFRFVANSDHVTLDGCKITSTATAISCNQQGITCSNFIFRNNEVYNIGDTGEAFYLGSVPDSPPVAIFYNGIIENNYIHDTTNPDGGSGAGVQIKAGSYNNTVRNNVVNNVAGPCYLTYDDYDRGVNYIYNNLCIKSKDNGIQVSAGAVIYNNVVVSANYGIYVSTNNLQSGKKSRNIKILHNTVSISSNSGQGIYIQGGSYGSSASTIQVVNNYAENYAGEAYKLNGAENAQASVSNNGFSGTFANSGLAKTSAGFSATANFQGASGYNFYPGSGNTLQKAGIATSIVTMDYNCNARSSTPTIGAYEFSSATNPKTVTPNGIKPACSGTPTPPPPAPTPTPPPPAPTPPPPPTPSTTGRRAVATTGRAPTPPPTTPPTPPPTTPTPPPPTPTPPTPPPTTPTPTPPAPTGNSYTVTPSDNWVAKLQSLKAGDKLTFSAGTYVPTSKVSVKLAGTAAKPILITGVKGATCKIARGNANQNIWDISGSYFTIQYLEFTGGSRGLRFGDGGSVDHATIQYNKIHETAGSAVTANDGGATYSYMTFRYNEVYNTGSDTSECFYMGCSGNGCTFRNGLFEFNYCHDTMSATSGYGSGFQVKTGAYNTVLVQNVCWNTQGPCMLLYDDYGMGVNRIESNFIYGSNENAIQVTAGAVVYNNVIIGAAGASIAGSVNSVQSGKNCRNLYIAHNSIYMTSSGSPGIYIPDAATNVSIYNNAVWAPSTSRLPASGVTASNNGYNGGSSFGSNAVALGAISSEVQSSTTNNFYPKSTSKLVKAGKNIFAAVGKDFNGLPRTTTPSIGAYEYSSSSNPNTWNTATGSIKTLPSGAIVSTNYNLNMTCDADDTETTSACPYNAECESGSCVCIDGYVIQDDACVSAMDVGSVASEELSGSTQISVFVSLLAFTLALLV